MKVAHIAYDLRIGGTTSILTQLLEHQLADTATTLILISAKGEGPAAIPGVETELFDYQPSQQYTIPAVMAEALVPRKRFGKIAEQIYLLWKGKKFDIIHFHVSPRELAIAGLLKKKGCTARLIYTDHSLRVSADEYKNWKGKLITYLYRRLYANVNCVFVSKQAFQWASQIRLINTRLQNTCIENSIAIDRVACKKNYQLSEIPSIVYVSRVTQGKGHFLLLPVAEKLRDQYGVKAFRIVIIGPGDMVENLEDKVDRHGLNEYFDIQGARNDVHSALAGFDIGVFPSLREGLPVALLEKMAAGLPVVASAIPEIENVIQHHEEALLFSVNDPADCAAQLYRLLQDQGLREKIGSTARLAVEKRYAAPLADRYTAFYKKLLSNG